MRSLPISLSNRHIPQLDGLRGIAVLMVMAFHFPKTPMDAFERVLQRLSMLGQTGVDLFFVLSGFLITGILLDTKGSPHSLKKFYVRRVLRIFPLYYGTLALLYILLPVLRLVPATPLVEQLWFWTYLQNVGFTFWQLAGPNHFWSLAVEEHFYLLWPILVARLDISRLKWCLLAAIAISIGTRWLLLAMGDVSFYFTFSKLDELALGSFLAIAARSESGLARLVPTARTVMLMAIPLSAAYAAFSGMALGVVQVVKTTIIGLLYAALLIIVLTEKSNATLSVVLSNRLLRSCGKYSYAMYMFHPFLFPAISPLIPVKVLIFRFMVGVGFVFLCAIVSWCVWERPFLKLKQRFEYSDAPAALASDGQLVM